MSQEAHQPLIVVTFMRSQFYSKIYQDEVYYVFITPYSSHKEATRHKHTQWSKQFYESTLSKLRAWTGQTDRYTQTDATERITAALFACSNKTLAGHLRFIWLVSLNPLKPSVISNVQCHKGLTYRFQFLTFRHSGAQRAERQSARMSEIENGRLGLYGIVQQFESWALKV